MDTVLQLNEFFVEGSDPSKSHVLLNITEPSTPEEKEKGYFFAICEIEGADNKYIMKIQSIIDEIENSYYETEDSADKTALEIVLHKVNQKSFGIMKEDTTLNCLMGVIRKNNIIFSFFGKPRILLFYKNKQGTYGRIDLLAENMDTDDDNKDDSQIFSQIIEGKINKNDYFYASTAKVEDYFTSDRLQKIISTRPPRQSAEHLERVLNELKNDISFGGMIIHLQSNPKEKSYNSKAVTKGGSAKSLSGLFSSQKKTANILSPSFLPNLKKKNSTAVIEKEQETSRTKKTEQSAQINSSHLKPRTTTRQVAVKASIDYRSLLKKILHTISTGAIYFGKFLYWLAVLIITVSIKTGIALGKLFVVAINYKNRRGLIIADWKHGIQNLKRTISSMPLSIKILFVVGIVIAISLLFGIMYINNKKQNQKQQQQFTQSLQSIKSKIDSGESYLIYNNTTKAFEVLLQAKKELTTLNCDSKNGFDCGKTGANLETMLNKVRKLYTVEPQLLNDWSSILVEKKVTSLAMIEKKIFGYSDNTGSIVGHDLLSQKSELVNTNQASLGFISSAVPKENDYAVFADIDNKIVQYNKDSNSWKTSEISYPNDNPNISGLFVYSRRLYSLDSSNKQIYRHDATKSGFGRGREWIKENNSADLSQAIGLAIDGDVFVATKNGSIYKFNNGKQQDYSITGIDPQLDNIDQIWTYYELNYLYILDSKNKRLIIIDKEDGTLKKQLTSAKFSAPSSMIVDENNSLAYILDKNKLFKIDLSL